ncbi:hypothetical protein IJT93_03705 [bacterium]|nr:hypothetical protein [bacterium]
MEADRQKQMSYETDGEAILADLPPAFDLNSEPEADAERYEGDCCDYQDAACSDDKEAGLGEAAETEDDKDILIAELIEENLRLKSELHKLQAAYEELLRSAPAAAPAKNEQRGEEPPRLQDARLNAGELQNLKAALAEEISSVYEERLARLEASAKLSLTQERLEQLLEQRISALSEELKGGAEQQLARQQDELNIRIEEKLNLLADRLQPPASGLNEERVRTLLEQKLTPIETEIERIQTLSQGSLEAARQALAKAEGDITLSKKAFDSFRQMLAAFNERQVFSLTPQLNKLYAEIDKSIQSLSQSRSELLENFDGLLTSLKLSLDYNIRLQSFNSFKKTLIKFIIAVLDYTKDNEANIYHVFTSKQIKDILNGVGCRIILPDENDAYEAETMEIKHYKNTADPNLHNKVCKAENFGLVWQLREDIPPEIIKKAEIVLYINY